MHFINSIIGENHIDILNLNATGALQLAETGFSPVKVFLNNSQDITTGVYNQLVNVPMNILSKHANANLANIQWQYPNGTIIPSWMQSYNNSTATWWLKIDNIPAHGSAIVFIVFYNKSMNVLNNVTTGESPLLSTKFDDGSSVFMQYDNSGLIENDDNILYPTNVGFYYFTKVYDPTDIPGNQGLVGWIYDVGIDTPMFSGLSNRTYLQPHFYVNGSHYLKPHISNGRYFLLGTTLMYPEAFWYVNNTVVQTANNSAFTNYSETYIRSTGVNISVLYSFTTILSPKNVMAGTSFETIKTKITIESTVKQINNNSGTPDVLNVYNNPNGYTISGNITHISVVRYGYFPGMFETSKSFYQIPIMGGLNYILVSNGSSHEVTFVSKDYPLLLIGVEIYLSTISAAAIYVILIFRRNKRGL